MSINRGTSLKLIQKSGGQRRPGSSVPTLNLSNLTGEKTPLMNENVHPNIQVKQATKQEEP